MIVAEMSVLSHNLVVIAVLTVALLLLWGIGRRWNAGEARRGDRLQQYAVLTPEGLAAIPDEELVEAVVANVMAKQDRQHPDLYRDVPLLSHGRCVITCVWLVDRELAAGSMADLLAGASGVLAELAADGMDTLGAVSCAAALRVGIAAADDEARCAADTAYREARAQEPLAEQMIAYIREDPAAFCDTPVVETKTEE